MTLIPYDDRDGFIWMDGKLVEWRKANIHVLSHGLHYASCVFEGERLYDGVIFKGREHSERLIRSAKLLDMAMPWTADQIDQMKEEVVKANKLTNAYIRAIAWRGPEQIGVSAQATKTHMACAAWDWGTYYSAEKREKGIALKTSKWRKPAPDTAPTESKASGLYMIGTISKHAVEREGYDDALMLDYRGNAAEATGANLFVVKDGTLITPPADCFLNGITRQTVIQLAKDMNIPFKEDFIKPGDLKNVQEIFLTGTAAEVTAVGRIDDLTFTVGPVTRRLRGAYEALVRGKDPMKAAAA